MAVCVRLEGCERPFVTAQPMGQEIVYCSRCSTQVRGPDFEKGRAFKIEEQVICGSCFGSHPALAPPLAAPARSESPAEHPSPANPRSGTRFRTLGPIPEEDPARTGRSPWVLVSIVGAAVILLGLTFVLSSGTPSPAPEPAGERPAAPLAPAANRVSLEAPGVTALGRAVKFASESPDDVDGQLHLFETALEMAQGIPLREEVLRERDRILHKTRTRRADALALLDAQVASAVGHGKRAEALALLEKAKSLHPDAEWTAAVDRRSRELESSALPPPPPSPVSPKGPPSPAPVTKPSPPQEPHAELWEGALSATQFRDYAAASKDLAKLPPLRSDLALDLKILEQISDLYSEAVRTLRATPRGKKLAVQVRDDPGAPRRVEGAFLREESGIVVLKAETEVVEVEIGEILPSSFIDLLKEKASSGGPQGPAAFCLLEGETEAADKLLGRQTEMLPSRYWIYARKVSSARRGGDSARTLYFEALKDLGASETAARGVSRIQELLRDHATDPFVLRNKPALLRRSQEAREFVLLAEDLRAAGTVRAVRGGKLETYWTSESEIKAGEAKDNYVEAFFSTLPDLPYRCWVLAGGCCQETFEFACQGSEVLVPAGKGTKDPALPGSAVSMPVKPWVSGLKKTHTSHNGPKHPARWEWVPVPLPKYTTWGTQRLRLLFEQKGFSVTCVWVTATRSAPPSDGELKEWIRSRGDRPRVEQLRPPQVLPLVTCLLDGTDRHLVGTLEKRSLQGVTLYDKCFTGLERSEPVTIPPQGELRVTYFLRTATKLSFRLRILRGPEQSVPYDFLVENPAVGVSTPIRIPFAQFKAIYLPGTPAVAPGDQTRHIYIFGDAVDCGLRLEALSLVEIRSAESARDSRPAVGDRARLTDALLVFSLDLSGGRKPDVVTTGNVVKAPDRPDERWCLSAEPQPGGVSPLFIDVGGPSSYRFEGEEVLTFDYWVDSEVSGICFNFFDRTRGVKHEGSVDRPVPNQWTQASFRMADLGEPQTRLRPGDLVAGLYLQALGGSTRKFLVDNLQVLKPRDATVGPWKPIFDGRTLEAFVPSISDAWRVEAGQLIHDNAVNDAAQTQQDFGDGEFRFRFEVRGVTKAYFALRQDPRGGSFNLTLEESEMSALQGKDHELIFSCRGDLVTAALDGKTRTLVEAGHPRAGRIQFNSFDGTIRIKGLDYREFR